MNENEEARRVRTVEIIETSCRCMLLFLMDFILNGSFVSLVLNNWQNLDPPSTFDMLFAFDRTNFTDVWQQLSWPAYVSFSFVYFCSIFVCICFLLITTNQLLSFIEWLVPLVLLVWSASWTASEFDSTGSILLIFSTSLTISDKLLYVFQLIIRIVFAVCASYLYNGARDLDFQLLPTFFLKAPFYASFLSTVGVDRLLSYCTKGILKVDYLHAPLFGAELLLVAKNAPGLAATLLLTYDECKRMVRDFGLQAFLSHHWNRLKAPQLLRTFWLSRFCLLQVFVIFSYFVEDELNVFSPLNGTQILDTNVTVENSSISMDNSRFNLEEHRWRCLIDFGRGFRYLTIRSCETFVSVLGTTSIVSNFGNFVGRLFDTFLQDVQDEDRNAGALTGVLFLILCLQTNITGLSADKRVAKLYRNLWLLSMALLHFVHNTVNSLLHRLTSTGNFRRAKHARALLVAVFLLVAPSVFLLIAWPSGEDMLNPWILSVAIFAFELIVKTLVSLIVYAISVVDALVFVYHPKTDDIVYVVRATGSILEFTFGVLLFFDGLWILFFEQGGLLRAFMICVHAYCNIYLQAVDGWAKLQRRRLAASKLDLLTDANELQIAGYNDVCCICYHNVSVGTTKITRCGHYFHSTCLRKWLYLQDKCPLCHQGIYASTNAADHD